MTYDPITAVQADVRFVASAILCYAPARRLADA
jgi:hypothetical protein